MPTDDSALPASAAGLTPVHLAAVCSRAGQVSPVLDQPFGYVVLGCGDGTLVATVAASHPRASVWAWDPHPERIEVTRRRRDRASLTNLEIHEGGALPDRFDGVPVDLVVVDGVLDAASDGVREQVARFIGSALRPGGLVAVSYRTTVGWTEIQPLVQLMRYVAGSYGGDRGGLVPHVLTLLRQLRDGHAAYIAKRPKVAAWVDEVLEADHDTIERHYLRDDLRPLSHGQVVRFCQQVGCTFIGAAHDDDAADLAPALAEIVRAAPTRTLRESYGDLATRRTHRIDVFRKGVQ